MMPRSWSHNHKDGVNWTHPETATCDLGEESRFVTKDSGDREKYDSGMVRDTNQGKPRFDLVLPEGVPYKDQLFTRVAELMARGAEKYGDRNWEKAAGAPELARAKESAFRHFMQWYLGETDEDHAAAVFFNIQEAEYVKFKQAHVDGSGPVDKAASDVTLETSKKRRRRPGTEDLDTCDWEGCNGCYEDAPESADANPARDALQRSFR